MIKNYLMIALRAMARQRGYSFINIIGLTIGISSSLFIGLFVADELRYDRFHDKEIYRLVSTLQDEKNTRTTALSAPAWRRAADKLPEVTATHRFAVWKTFPIRFEQKTFTEQYLVLADSNFFSFFQFELVAGERHQVLQGERQLVITQSAAARYFNYTPGSEQTIIGKTLLLAQGYEVKVSGIAKDPPAASHFHFTHVLSLASWRELSHANWTNPTLYTYMKLIPEAEPEAIQKKINALARAQAGNDSLAVRGSLQSIARIHLHSSLDDEIEKNGSIGFVYFSIFIAVFIALLACINFVNLATARAANRSKEVAVRKAVGASSQVLLRQFFLESYFYIALSLLFSYGVLALLLPIFNYFTGKSIAFSYLIHPEVIVSLLLIAAVIGILAGLYPSIYLARYNPIEVLRGQLRAHKRKFGVRNVLVVFQFFIASLMIIGTLVVSSQLHYLNELDPGFAKENVLKLLHTKNLLDKGSAFQQALKQLPGVINASYTSRMPPHVQWEAHFTSDSGKHDVRMFVCEMDQEHLATLNLTMVSGRFFSSDPADTNAIILNETAVRTLGWKEPQQKIFSHYDQPEGKMRTVIGVIRDYHFQSAKEPIKPLAIVPGDIPNWEMAIRVKTSSLDSMRTAIETLWNEYTEQAPFELHVLEQEMKNVYQAERTMSAVIVVFTLLAIVIACLGLYGLASFTTAKRNKEIGIRKVLGASVTSVAFLLNRQFLALVLLGNLLAVPVAWVLLRWWLLQFEYHILLSASYFVFATLITLSIAVLSVSYQSIKASLANPVNSLRTE